jgi:hypothetical protein
MPSNFREGMRRVGIVLGLLGSVAGGIGGYFLAVHARALAAAASLQESALLQDYAVASTLPVIGFLLSWGSIHVLVWIWAGFSEEPPARGQGKATGR